MRYSPDQTNKNPTKKTPAPHPFWLDLHFHMAGTLQSPFSVLTEMAAAKSLQSCPTLCNPIDGSPPGPPIPGILQGRTLEWVAIAFSASFRDKK